MIVDVPNNPFRLREKNALIRCYQHSQRKGGARFLTAWLAGLVVAFWGFRKIKGGGAQLKASFDDGAAGRGFTITDSNAQFFCIYSPQYRSLYEPDVEAALETFLRDGDCFLDIGSNWGYYGIKLALSPAKKIKVHCFEPSPRSYADLARIKGQLGLGDALQAHNFALSSSEGSFRLVQLGFESGLATLKADEVPDKLRAKEGGAIKSLIFKGGISEEVKTRRLDSFGLERCDVIKLDVEGAELEVLSGASSVFEKFQPIVIFEHWFRGPESFAKYRDFFQEKGYDLFQVKASVAGRGVAANRTSVEFSLRDVRMETDRQYHLVAFPKSKSLKSYL